MLKNSNEGVNLVLTGGHAATPGLAVIEKLRETYKDKNLNIFWIGSKKAIEGSNTKTLEYKIFSNQTSPKLGVNFIGLTTGKIQTKLTRYTILSLLKIPIGFIHSLLILIKIRPKVIFSFGGYASFPVVFWGWVFRIPVILHEQTIVAGRASRASSFFATKIALAHTESSRFFPASKIVITGNPIIKEILDVKPKKHPDSPPSILVMGGSRGSEFINEEIVKLVPSLAKKYKLVHITGETHYDSVKKYESPNYKVIASVQPLEMAKHYQKADLIISRSGANSVAEIIVTKRPAILIPLPRTYMNEQIENARYAERFGIAKVMLEKEVTTASLSVEIEKIFNNWHKIQTQVSKKDSQDINATQKIIDLSAGYILG